MKFLKRIKIKKWDRYREYKTKNFSLDNICWMNDNANEHKIKWKKYVNKIKEKRLT